MNRERTIVSGIFLLLSLAVFWVSPLEAKDLKAAESQKAGADTVESVYAHYMNCLERVYDTMDKNYYRPISREAYNGFLEKFNKDLYAKAEPKDKKINFVCWRSAAYLVDHLKDPEDTFSAFFPPKAAETFEMKALGQRIDLGIEGRLTTKGYDVTQVEPRSDAYLKGLRPQDTILTIDGANVLGLSEKDIESKLTPLIHASVRIFYLDHLDGKKKTIRPVSQEYFKQTVFMIPVDVPGIFCLHVKSFNKETASDLFRFLSFIEKQGKTGLVLDLRENPGGPPLAAREMSAFFLSPEQDFAYFQKRGDAKSLLNVPGIPAQYHYDGPMAILVNKGSGSSSELFSGVLQKRGRAILVGERTAGKVMLKSMFDYDDNSMLLLVTARGYMYDDTVFPFSGLTPDVPIADKKADIIHIAASYLKKKLTAQ